MEIQQHTIVLDESLTQIINEEFRNILISFLEKRNRTGSRTAQTYYSAIKRFLEFTKISSIRDITYDHTTKYFTWLDRHPNNFKLSYKSNQMKYCRSFFDYAEHIFQSKRIPFYNPVPKVKYFNFTPDETLSINEMEEKQQDQFYTKEQLKIILEKISKADYERYVQVLLLTFCGMRGSEVVSIRKDNVKVYERYLLTGMEKNARKSSKNGNGIVFCFPKEVAIILGEYLLYHENKYGESEKWLFPGNKGEHTSIRNLQKFLTSLNFEFSVRTHKFRKTLSTWRQEIQGVKTPTYVMETLSNHAISSIEHKHYAQYGIEQRLRDYDTYFPTELKELLQILPS
ncbi:MAG: tyrosine-type recombinase/integrase [Candidatus Lokiarchaeota archaeon]|nr:tyrosine-type recombinase/integrase [Candidatus Lokiarchaeota archaeon]